MYLNVDLNLRFVKPPKPVQKKTKNQNDNFSFSRQRLNYECLQSLSNTRKKNNNNPEHF